MDISKALEADSTQINAADLTGAPRTVTITGVGWNTKEQPVNIEVEEFPGKAYRPCKSMLRVLATAWGKDAKQWVGRKMTIYNDVSVRFGPKVTGGVRISALSHIDQKLSVTVPESREKFKTFVVEPLKESK